MAFPSWRTTSQRRPIPNSAVASSAGALGPARWGVTRSDPTQPIAYSRRPASPGHTREPSCPAAPHPRAWRNLNELGDVPVAQRKVEGRSVEEHQTRMLILDFQRGELALGGLLEAAERAGPSRVVSGIAALQPRAHAPRTHRAIRRTPSLAAPSLPRSPYRMLMRVGPPDTKTVGAMFPMSRVGTGGLTSS